jgi:hypothetical protein
MAAEQRGAHQAARSPSTIFFRSFSTSSRRYIRYELIGWRRAGNFPRSSQRRSVGRLTPRSLAVSAMVIRSAGSGFRRRDTGDRLSNLDHVHKEGLSCPASMGNTVTVQSLDQILALQLVVAWAGEGRCEPKRFGWWDTDLIDMAGGGDLVARLAPRTHAWASLELVREAARRVDARARGRHGDPDKLRSIFFLGFEVDEKVTDRLAELKRQGRPPEEALPLPFKLGSEFAKEQVVEALSVAGKVAFEKVPPAGRQLKGAAPESPHELVQKLAAALVPIAPEYPLPFFQAGA